ncbi:uncharacterized protein LOC141608695 [Silene latifolia]|uniref:uncharacterized protein LOC141608695 n=1 Tax=Silene latifolia TaxID=37657 RepID=UPI003D7869AB
MMRRAAEINSLHGIPVAAGAPAISHLLFADDSILFTKARLEEADVIRYILNRYEKASGQLVNIDKTTMSFSKGIPLECRDNLARRLGFVVVDEQQASLETLNGTGEPLGSSGGFMDAPLGHNPSYIWRGIVEARKAIQGGLRRRIGDGLTTRVWHDAWLPVTQTGRVISPLVAGYEDLRVADLLVGGNGSWNEELITSLFLPFERERISNIRVSSNRPPDTWAWCGEKDGVFTVKSAYRFLAANGDAEGLKPKNGGNGGRLKRAGDKGWTPPPREFVRVNVDAGVKEGEGVGMGLVCRDEMGRVLWGSSVVQGQSWDPQVAEAAAVLEGIKEAIRFGHKKVILESGCLTVIDALKRKAVGRSIFSLVIDDILALCTSFNSISWSFVSRANNCVAHELAHPVPRVASSFVGSEELPPSVNNAVRFDLSIIQ